MKDKKDMIVYKENIFTRIVNKIKGIFGIKKEKEKNPEEIVTINNSKENSKTQKDDFISSLKVKKDSFGIIYLKMKLEKHEIRAVDLTDEQIDELQEIYDKEIREKKEKIRRLQSIQST